MVTYQETETTSFHNNMIAQRQKIKDAEIPVNVIENFNSDKVSDEDVATLKESLNIPLLCKMGVSKDLDFKDLLESLSLELKTAHDKEIDSYGVKINPNAKYAYVSVRNPDDTKKEVHIKCLMLRKCCFSTGYKYYVDYPMTNLFMWIRHNDKMEEFCESINAYLSKETKDCEAVLRGQNLSESLLRYTIAAVDKTSDDSSDDDST